MTDFAPDQPERKISADIRFYPSRALQPGLITSYYFTEIHGPAGTEIEDWLHPEWGNLRLGFGPVWDIGQADGGLAPAPHAALFGPTSRARAFRARPGLMLGIGFTPEGWASLVKMPASALADAWAPADAVLPGIAALRERLEHAGDDQARIALLDDWLTSLLPRYYRPDPKIAAILAGLGNPEEQTVEELARHLGMTPARLVRACRRWFGFSTKTLLRRQRFLRTLASLLEPQGRPISEVLDHAYCDQSHFNREFRRFMGMSPRAYFALPRPLLRSAASSRLREVGAALQGLHRLQR
ncbi:MAG: AraC family transcriptional regulator [Proteobacteria bacterium]|nr:AraC family transcriptional regulator [Pseudomonadota bacterium]